MPKFFIEQRCTHLRELEVEADDEDAAWDAYHDENRWFSYRVTEDDECESTGAIRQEGDPAQGAA